MALLKSLKKVLTELGGTPEPRDLTAKTIDKIADNISGGGGGAEALIIGIHTEGEYAVFDQKAIDIINALPLVFIVGQNPMTDATEYTELGRYKHDGSEYSFYVEDLRYKTSDLYGFPKRITEV